MEQTTVCTSKRRTYTTRGLLFCYIKQGLYIFLVKVILLFAK